MLFVRRLDRDEIRPIPGTDGAALPFLSPDGLQVGFFAEGKLKKVALDGGSPITLCDARIPRGGSWGADGTIVFTPSAMSGLQRISSSGGEPRPVTTPDAAKGEKHLFPQVLPDGEHVLFDLTDRDRTGVAAVVSLRTGVQKAVLPDAPYPRYLPTGHLVFTRPGSLFAVPFDLKNLEASGPPVPLLDRSRDESPASCGRPSTLSRRTGRSSTSRPGSFSGRSSGWTGKEPWSGFRSRLEATRRLSSRRTGGGSRRESSRRARRWRSFSETSRGGLSPDRRPKGPSSASPGHRTGNGWPSASGLPEDEGSSASSGRTPTEAPLRNG